MNIRWANIWLSNNVLNINTKTQFAKKGIDTADNLNLLVKTLSDIWVVDPKINIT
jgi:hypothetical protein